MTVSTSDTFDEGCSELIGDALAIVGAVGPNQTPTGDMVAHGMRVLNRLVKSIDADGEFLWRISRRTFTTTAALATRTLGTDVLDVDQPMRFTRAGQNGSTPIRPWSRDDYMRVADRTSSGVPQWYFVEYALPNVVTVTFWPVPDATGDTIEYAASLRGKNFDDASQTGDFPTKWLECLVTGVAARVAPVYMQAELGANLEQQFQAERARLVQEGTERGDVYLVAFGGNSAY